MSINNLQNISDFSKKNNSFSDFNIVKNVFLNLNFTKYRTNKKITQTGGQGEIPGTIGLPNPIDTTGQMGMQPPMIIDQTTGNPMGPPMPAGVPLPMDMVGTTQNPSLTGFVPQGMTPQTDSTQRVCRQETITNPDGSIIKREICDNYMSMFPDLYLPKPSFVTGEIKTFTIPKGTVLYHSVDNKRGFNTENIQLGNDKIIVFFTPNFRLASDRIQGCSIKNKKVIFMHLKLFKIFLIFILNYHMIHLKILI